jgi:phosphate-selective porin OprO and OprP
MSAVPSSRLGPVWPPLAALLAVCPLTVAAQAQDSEPAPEVSAAPGHGITVRSADGRFSLNVRARIQVRETLGFSGGRSTGEFQIRTGRLFVQGHVLSPDVRYLIQTGLTAADYEAGSPSPLYDAFVEYVGWRDAQLRAGQFFVPFDRARTIREFALQLVDRQQVVSELGLARDVGVTLSSGDLGGHGGRWTYALGIFSGAGRNRTGLEPLGFLYAARLGWRPFGEFDDDTEGDLERLPRPRLALGVAGAYNDRATRSRSTLGSNLTLDTVDFTHAAADLVFKHSGFSLLAEALYRRASPGFREGTPNATPTREWAGSGWGYLVQVGLMLTSRLEIAARWDELLALEETDPALVRLAQQQGRETGAGLNYYLNGHLFKFQADYAFRFGQDSTPPIHLVRLQLDATF